MYNIYTLHYGHENSREDKHPEGVGGAFRGAGMFYISLHGFEVSLE